MAILIELYISDGVIWEDTPDVAWEDTDDVSWEDTITAKISDEGFEGDTFWDDDLIESFSLQYKMSTAYGGYCRLGFGTIELMPDTFEDYSEWPPPISMKINVYYTITNEADKELLFSGICHQAGLGRKGIVYGLYGDEHAVNLLAETTDYNGDTVAVPRAFGAVQHQRVIRLPDVSGDETYHNGYLTGTKGVDWSIFDDGVNIDANATDNGDDTFSLSVAAVGEVTVSGTGTDTTLSEIMAWACETARLNLSYDSSAAESPSPDVSFWADSQQLILDFLSDLAAYFSHLFYIRNSSLYLVGMAEDNGSRTITEYDIEPSEIDYDAPTGLITAKWIIRDAVTDRTGNHIKDTPYSTSRASAYPYGKKMDIKPYETAISDVYDSISDILDTVNKPIGDIKLKLVGSLPVPGEKITLLDESIGDGITSVVHARSLRYIFGQDEVVIRGEGAIS